MQSLERVIIPPVGNQNSVPGTKHMLDICAEDQQNWKSELSTKAYRCLWDQTLKVLLKMTIQAKEGWR